MQDILTTKIPLSVLTRITEKQREVVERLMAKGWIDPFYYRRSVSLGLPNLKLKRLRGSIARDYTRGTIRVTPSGRILRP